MGVKVQRWRCDALVTKGRTSS